MDRLALLLGTMLMILIIITGMMAMFSGRAHEKVVS